jgi:D-arginine dehydrogenase
MDCDSWPAVADIDETFYFVPENNRLLLSPADETPVVPGDAYPDDLDVAQAVDRLETATMLNVRRIDQQWAGLRTFAPDRTPVVGFDPLVDGLFWLAGQGGYGIQTAPALSRCAAALVRGVGVPAALAVLGVTETTLSPARIQEHISA